jgi:asparagine synthase (glutamine-hydrolysing)
MSGLLAVIDPTGRLLAEPHLTRPLAALSSRGDRYDVSRRNGAVVAVARFDWELAGEFSGECLVLNDGDLTIAADATLYYRDDLLRALAAVNIRPAGRTASHLIAAAYRAWGEECVEHLEGDFAFVLRDHTNHRTFAARDFMGRRPLYFAEIDGALMISSMVRALIAHPDCPNDYDDIALAEIVSVSLADADRTPYHAVRALPAATSLAQDGRSSIRVRRFWTLSLREVDDPRSFDDASDSLREMLANAVVERRAASSSTAVWLSGGYDSPVMFAVGNAKLDELHLPRLAAISVSYPVGDAGREDELIVDIANFWKTNPRWLSIEDLPLLANAVENASRSDVPFQHAFENWLRALLGATAEHGSRVALYGDGGDQLFAVSGIFLQDLFRQARFRELRKEWRAFGGHGARALWQTVARPALSYTVRAARGLSNANVTFPDWMRHDFVAAHAMREREFAAEDVLANGGGGRASIETRRAIGNPIVPRVLAGMSALALDYGVEMRAPLFDRRIVDFALGRPRRERASAGVVKHLLRRTARELLPPHVLAPRPAKTGVLTDYFSKSFRSDPDGLVSDTFSRSLLAERGIVDGAALQHAWHTYKTTGRGASGNLFFAFQVEMWLLARNNSNAIATAPIVKLTRTPAAEIVQ